MGKVLADRSEKMKMWTCMRFSWTETRKMKMWTCMSVFMWTCMSFSQTGTRKWRCGPLCLYSCGLVWDSRRQKQENEDVDLYVCIHVDFNKVLMDRNKKIKMWTCLSVFMCFVGFLFLLVSGKGCGLWLWHALDFSLTFFVYGSCRQWTCRPYVCIHVHLYAIFNDQSFYDTLTNDIVSFEQLSPVC